MPPCAVGNSLPPSAPRGRIGILGGSFDPVHIGHLAMARCAWRVLSLDSLRFIPLRFSPRSAPPVASAVARQAMLDLAVNEAFSNLRQVMVDPCELRRSGVSRTVDTLQCLRGAFPDAALIWLLGEDAFAGLTSWWKWQSLLDYAHLVVLTRKGIANGAVPSAALQDWMQDVQTTEVAHLGAVGHGYIYRLCMPPVPVSSSEVRRRLVLGQDVHELVPESVWDYLRRHRPYPAGTASDE